jgi:hypothetical protein
VIIDDDDAREQPVNIAKLVDRLAHKNKFLASKLQKTVVDDIYHFSIGFSEGKKESPWVLVNATYLCYLARKR